MAVTTEHRGAVTTIILDRVERRNAIDSPTAKALRAAFRTFERNREVRVAVLWGANGTFCAGADLKAYAERRQRRPSGSVWPTASCRAAAPARRRRRSRGRSPSFRRTASSATAARRTTHSARRSMPRCAASMHSAQRR